MNVFSKIMAGIGAILITATTMGLPDVCGYCTVRAMATQAQGVSVSSYQTPVTGDLSATVSIHVAHA